jgi:hypothetical protein
MATWDDVRRLALALPETTEEPGRTTAWKIRGKAIAWERPLGKADRAALAAAGIEAPPDELILAARAPDLGAVEALIADDPAVYFTIPHFSGFPAVLVRLGEIDVPELAELLTEAWLDRAPKRLVTAFLAAAAE